MDDSTIKVVGSWRAVQATMKASRLQPSLLLFEQEGRA
jgi:hypothetical protein